MPDRVDDLRPVEQARALLDAEPVLDVAVLEHLGQRAAPLVLADHVRRDVLLLRRALEEEGEDSTEVQHLDSDCILRFVKKTGTDARSAERVLEGVDDTGRAERIVIWIERRPGAVWSVGRAVNPQHRPSGEPRRDDWIFEGYELDDALEAANGALEDDVTVIQGDGATADAKPFTRKELLPVLERFFFGRR